MRTVTRTRGVAIGVAAVLAMAGCTGTPRPRDPLATRTRADVGAEVQTQADQIAKLVGNPLQNAKINSAKCVYRPGKTGDGSIIVMQGSYQIALPSDRHASTAAKVRDAWTAAGWTITDDATQDKAMELAATTPAQYTVRLASTTPPNALVVLVQSPCFHDSDAA
jgi:hypothetical protein